MPGCASYASCARPPAAALQKLPEKLSQTGLFADATLRSINARARGYEPAFPLWSDGAVKRRWLALPSGARIDTSDMDDWRFPEGTRVWKEFSLNGRQLETRMLMKVGPGERDWSGAAYVWLPDGSDAVLAPDGAEDIDGTQHDAPNTAQCVGCHGGRRSYVLGFSAIQLASVGGDALGALRREGLLTHVPEHAPAISGDETQRKALGYLHANCGNCHNRHRPTVAGPRCYDPRLDIDFWVATEREAALRQVGTYVPEFVEPGEPEASRVISVISRRSWLLLHMPPLASERVDEEGVAILRQWIERMPPVGFETTAVKQ
jgi:mono/diheme cytochrome c family protein